MSKDKCEEYVLKYFKNHSESTRKNKPINVKTYLINPVHDVYKRYKKDFGKWTNKFGNINSTPFFTKQVFDNVPKYLKRFSRQFEDRREQDITLLGAISAISGCFRYYEGIYENKSYGPHMFSFICAPPASGKGKLSHIYSLTRDIDRCLKEDFRNALNEYNEREDKNDGAPKPERAVLFIPANSSKSIVIKHLEVNDGIGIMFESEADTLTNMFKHEGSNFSDDLRKIFQLEQISFSRRTNEEYVYVEKPKLAFLLSGTQSQLSHFLPNVDNGLISRFIFYIYNNKQKWRDPLKKESSQVFEHVIKELREDLYQRYILFENKSVSFSLTENQLLEFNIYFENLDEDVFENYGNDGSSIVFRLGLIFFRICMVFAILEQKVEKTVKIEDLVYCSDKSFLAAINIIDTLIIHSLKVFSIIKKQSFKKINHSVKSFLDALPNEFSRKEADNIASKLEIKYKTAEKYISDMVNKGMIIRTQHGLYRKADDYIKDE